MILAIFSTRCRKNMQISGFMEIRPVGAELFYVVGRADMSELSYFSHFCEQAPIKHWKRKRKFQSMKTFPTHSAPRLQEQGFRYGIPAVRREHYQADFISHMCRISN